MLVEGSVITDRRESGRGHFFPKCTASWPLGSLVSYYKTPPPRFPAVTNE